MAGAVTHTWPTEVRELLVQAVLDQGLDQKDALRQAKAGELDGTEDWNGHVPGRTTLAGWVQQEATKRARDVHRVLNSKPLWEQAEQALARYLLPIFEDAERVASGREPRLSLQSTRQIMGAIEALKRACPQAGKPPRPSRAKPQPEAQPQPAEDKGSNAKASTLAERLAARANKTTNTKQETQRETQAHAPRPPDHSHSEEEGGSDLVERGRDGEGTSVAA